jgi:hypothetical protein
MSSLLSSILVSYNDGIDLNNTASANAAASAEQNTELENFPERNT